MQLPKALDRINLVQDVVDRVPHLGSKGSYLKQMMQDKLIEHKQYIDKRGGQDLPEICSRKWLSRRSKRYKNHESKQLWPSRE